MSRDLVIKHWAQLWQVDTYLGPLIFTWKVSQIAFKRKQQIQLLKKARFSLPCRRTTLGLGIILFIFIHPFCVHKSTYVGNMYAYSASKMLFGLEWTYTCRYKYILDSIYKYSWHLQDSLLKCFIFSPMVGNSPCFLLFLRLLLHHRPYPSLHVCLWLSVRRPS